MGALWAGSQAVWAAAGHTQGSEIQVPVGGPGRECPKPFAGDCSVHPGLGSSQHLTRQWTSVSGVASGFRVGIARASVPSRERVLKQGDQLSSIHIPLKTPPHLSFPPRRVTQHQRSMPASPTGRARVPWESSPCAWHSGVCSQCPRAAPGAHLTSQKAEGQRSTVPVWALGQDERRSWALGPWASSTPPGLPGLWPPSFRVRPCCALRTTPRAQRAASRRRAC